MKCEVGRETKREEKNQQKSCCFAPEGRFGEKEAVE